MKKVLLFITLLLFIPIINAEEKESEVEYKWYKLVEKDIRYESDVENSCEYFDKSNFLYTDYKYSMDKPDDKEGRIIEEFNPNINFHRQFFNKIKINGFFVNYNETVNIIDLNFTTNENENIPFKINNSYKKIADQNDETYMSLKNIEEINIDFPNTVDASNFKITIRYINLNKEFLGMRFQLMLTNEISLNAFYSYNEFMENTCEGNICTLKIKINMEKMYNEDIDIKTILYKYKDTLYKCYSLERIYAPGYYKDLEEYIKDEEKFKIIIKEKVEIKNQPDETNNIEDKTDDNNQPDESSNIEDNNQSEIPKEEFSYQPIENTKSFETNYNLNLPEEIVEIKKNNTLIETPKSTVAYNDVKTKETTKESSDKYYFLLSLIILILILGSHFIIKNIKKSRTK